MCRFSLVILMSLCACVALASEKAGKESNGELADMLPDAPAGAVWKLVWHDEFDGTKLDEAKWNIPEHKCRDAWWTRKAVGLDGNGHLVIRVFKEGDRYYDAGIHTRGKFEQAFGYFVVRMLLQKRPGHWSAFWLWNTGMKQFRERFEIDIMERPWLDDRIQHTFHWVGPGGTPKSLGEVARVPGVAEGWHTFGLLWTPDEYVFYVDGRQTWRPRGAPIWREPLYILITDEIQFNGWAGDIRKASLPDEFLVDYVRVYSPAHGKTGQTSWPGGK